MSHCIEQPTSTFSLKEWAIAIKALGTGKQIITIRKGGLYEETREFKLESNRFYLYPTYEHQKAELVKPDYQHLLQATLEGWSSEQPISIPIDESYKRCKSWHHLLHELPRSGFQPVLSDEEYALRKEAISKMLSD